MSRSAHLLGGLIVATLVFISAALLIKGIAKSPSVVTNDAPTIIDETNCQYMNTVSYADIYLCKFDQHWCYVAVGPYHSNGNLSISCP